MVATAAAGTTTMPLPEYNLYTDELRIALSYANADITLTPIEIMKPTTSSSSRSIFVAAGGALLAGDKKEEKKEAAPSKKNKADDDDFDVFGDDDEEGEDGGGGETRAEMLARLKKEAEERTARKEAKQRTLVAIEIKPWDVEQDLMSLWKKITLTVKQDGLKWGENCTLADVAFGIKKIQTTFVMGVQNSSDDVIEAIEAMEDEVQSAEVTSMNVL